MGERRPSHGSDAKQKATTVRTGGVQQALRSACAKGASAGPYGFVFRLAKTRDNELVWNFIAFGERHPGNPSTRSVYERAHKRLHGLYPDQSV